MKNGLAALLLLLLPLPAYTTFLNTPDGGRIRTGDSAAKVLIQIGDPLRKTYTDVCGKKDRYGICLRWFVVERWYYFRDDLYWTLVVTGGTVQSVDWARR